MTMNQPGYESLAQVLQDAYDQAARGKGAERHADGLPFHEQPMQQIARRRGLGFIMGQVDKKTQEAQGMLERGERDAWRREILGAINYLAGALVFTAPDRSATVEARESDSPKWRDCAAAGMPEPGRRYEVRLKDGDGTVLTGQGRRAALWIPSAVAWRYVD